MKTDTEFAELTDVLHQKGVGPACQYLVDCLKQQKRFEELFDARLMQCRHRLGLPVVDQTDLEDLPEKVREKLEGEYLSVCREVGGLLGRLLAGVLEPATS